MASANSQQPAPNPVIYDFEGQFDDAIKAGFAVAMSSQVAGQQGQDILVTPRFESKFMSGQQEQRSYLVPGTQDPARNNLPWAYQDMWKGTLYVKVVTNRLKDKGLQQHRQDRAVLRMMMLNFTQFVNPKYISIVQSLESSTQADIDDTQGRNWDISAIAFAVTFIIDQNKNAFPVPS